MMTTLLFAAVAAVDAVGEMPAVTVYASRIEDRKDDMPAMVHVMDASQVSGSGARDLPDLLKKKAGLDVRALSGNPMQSAVYMRGFGENGFGRVKLLLDGEELNNVDMAPPNLMRVPLGNVERVEVIHGPSPVLYGDGAVAGVVSAATDTRDYTRKTRITGRAGSQNTYGGNFSTKGGFEEDGLQYSGSYDYLQSGGYRKRSAYDMHAANAALRKNFENGSTIGFKANYQNAFYEMPGALTYNQWKHARKSANNHDDWARLWSYGMGIDSRLKLADDQWLHIDGGFSHQYRHARYASSASDLEYDIYCYYLSTRYVNEMDVHGFGNKFTVGSDFRFDRYGEDHPSSFGTPVKRHFGRARYAAFAHDEFYIAETLSVVAGARIERIGNRWARYGNLRESHSHDWMGDYELGLVFRPVNGLKTYVKGTRFHRSAFCDELNTQDGKFLEPETGESLDIGVEWEFLGEFKLDANGYGMIMEDEIFYDPLIPPWGCNSNSPSKTRRIGFDTGLTWLRDKFAEASVRYSLVRAEFAEGRYHGKDVPLAPNHRIRAEAGVWLCDDLEIKGGFSFVGPQRVSGDFSNTYDRLKAYSLFDIGAYYSPSWAEGWKLAAVMDNIFDRNYCDFAGQGYYYPACGRSFMATLSYEF